jgi:hypothetical protein
LVFVFLFCLGSISIAPAQSGSRDLRHCYLEAQNVSNSDELFTHWEDGWGSYDKEQRHRMALKIRVGTTGREGGEAEVRWYWIGRTLIENRLVVYGGGARKLEIPAGYFKEFYMVAPFINQRDRNYVMGPRYVTGARHEGWVICVVDRQQRFLAAKASSEPMQRLFKDWDQFEKLLPSPRTPAMR